MSKARILLIDDEEFFLKTIGFFLEANDYEVIPFSNSTQALSSIKEMFNKNEKIDLIITDIIMPGLSGIELINNLFESNINIPVLIITGFSDEEDLHNLNKKIKVEIITKPFDRKTLLKKIEAILFDNSIL